MVRRHLRVVRSPSDLPAERSPVTDDRARPPSTTAVRRQLARGVGALGLALSLLAQPGLAAAGVDDAAGSIATARPIVAQAHPDTVARLGEPDPDSVAASPADDPITIPPPADDTPPVVQEPSIIALDAAAHEHDRITFTPGGPVRVPFRPRPDDGWTVDGIAPRTLAGRRRVRPGHGRQPPGRDLGPPRQGPEARVPDPVTWAPDTDRWAGTRTGASPRNRSRHWSHRSGAFRHWKRRRSASGDRVPALWELNDRSTRLDYRLLSTIAYFRGRRGRLMAICSETQPRRLDLGRLGGLDQLPDDIGHRGRPPVAARRVINRDRSGPLRLDDQPGSQQSALLGAAPRRNSARPPGRGRCPRSRRRRHQPRLRADRVRPRRRVRPDLVRTVRAED